MPRPDALRGGWVVFTIHTLTMEIHLIQPRELFGPPERWEELSKCWGINNDLFSELSVVHGKPTFNEMFDYCRGDAVNVICNSDICFDMTSKAAILGSISRGTVYALSRWDVDTNGNAVLYDHADSQDAWVFVGKPTGIDAPFTMGVPGCDNHLAWLIKQAGYTVLNPSRTIRAYHLHNVQWRSYLTDPEGRARGGQKIGRIPPPYHLVKPTHL